MASGHRRTVTEHKLSQTNQNVGVWSRERFIAGPGKEMDGLCPENPKLAAGFQQNVFKGQVRAGHGLLLQTSWCQNPLFLQLPSRSGQDVPVNLQDKRCSLFCNFLSLYEWKSVVPLKVRALRMGYPVYFRL